MVLPALLRLVSIIAKPALNSHGGINTISRVAHRLRQLARLSWGDGAVRAAGMSVHGLMRLDLKSVPGARLQAQTAANSSPQYLVFLLSCLFTLSVTLFCLCQNGCCATLNVCLLHLLST